MIRLKVGVKLMNVTLENCSDLIGTEELRDLTGFDIQTVRCLLREKEIPGLKIGSRWFVPKKQLEEFLTKRLEENSEND